MCFSSDIRMLFVRSMSLVCATGHVGFPTLFFDVEGTSKEDLKWDKSEKAGKVEGRLFQEQKKALQNGTRIAPIRQVLPKLQDFEH